MIRWSGAKAVLVSGVCAAAIVAGGPAIAAAQEALTEETYGPTMSEIRLIVGDAELHVDARYWPELGEDLDKLFPMFRQIEAFWAARGNDDAVAKALVTIEALREIGAAGGRDGTGPGADRHQGPSRHLPVVPRRASGGDRGRLPDQAGVVAGRRGMVFARRRREHVPGLCRRRRVNG